MTFSPKTSWSKLKERRLVEWVLAYLAGAWLVLQIVSVIAQGFEWGVPLLRITTVVLGMGFFVAVVIAWYHGEKGRQRVSATELAVLMVLLVIAGAGVFLIRPRADSAPAESTASADPVYAHTAVAVLPFENLSVEGPHSYFAAGLHDEVLTQLSKVAALRVISRTSLRGYLGRDIPLRQIANELQVGSVVEGSVQVVGNRLRVTVQLVDAATDRNLWAERYDGTLEDAFAIQSNIAQQIVAAVGAALSQADQLRLAQAPTANPDAYQLYLQARQYYTRPGFLRENFESAEQLLSRALGLDPGFALARAMLSQVHGEMFWFRHDPSPGRAARQRSEAEAALRLAPDLPQAHLAMGLAHYWGRRDYRRALAEFDVAARGLPNDARLWLFIGHVHRRLGNWERVLDAFEKATALDPRDADLFYDLGGHSYHIMHRYGDAIRAYQRALSLAPDHRSAAVHKARAYVAWQGQLDTLRAVLARIPNQAVGGHGPKVAHQAQLLLWQRKPVDVLTVLSTADSALFSGIESLEPIALYAGWAHRLRGDQVRARAAFDSARVQLDSLLARLPDDWRVHAARGVTQAALGYQDEALREAQWLQRSPVYREDAFDGAWLAEHRARILAQTGRSEEALDEIERLLQRPSWLSVHMLKLDPLWDPLRKSERFRVLVARYGAR